MTRLAGKSAIVTGGGSGFGEGIAHRFAEEGAEVMVVDLNGDAAEKVAADIGGSATAFKCDVASDTDVAALFAAAADRFGGKLDVLVNNAGIAQRNGPMLDVDEETFDRIFAVNVKSIYLAAKHGLHLLKAAKGNIVNTSSTAALRPRPGLVWYNGSKGAVNTITKAMALELAPEVRVNAICPVIGATGLTSEFMGGEDTPELREKFIGSVPMGRMSTPLDIANAALYLAGSEGVFITGVCLEVDGGRCV